MSEEYIPGSPEVSKKPTKKRISRLSKLREKQRIQNFLNANMSMVSCSPVSLKREDLKRKCVSNTPTQTPSPAKRLGATNSEQKSYIDTLYELHPKQTSNVNDDLDVIEPSQMLLPQLLNTVNDIIPITEKKSLPFTDNFMSVNNLLDDNPQQSSQSSSEKNKLKPKSQFTEMELLEIHQMLNEAEDFQEEYERCENRKQLSQLNVHKGEKRTPKKSQNKESKSEFTESELLKIHEMFDEAEDFQEDNKSDLDVVEEWEEGNSENEYLSPVLDNNQLADDENLDFYQSPSVVRNITNLSQYFCQQNAANALEIDEVFRQVLIMERRSKVWVPRTEFESEFKGFDETDLDTYSGKGISRPIQDSTPKMSRFKQFIEEDENCLQDDLNRKELNITGRKLSYENADKNRNNKSDPQNLKRFSSENTSRIARRENQFKTLNILNEIKMDERRIMSRANNEPFQKLSENIDKVDNDLINEKKSVPIQCGEFTTAAGKEIIVSQKALSQASALFNDLSDEKCLLELEQYHINKKSSKLPNNQGLNRVSTFENNEQKFMDGFTTASGSQIKISEERMKQASKMFQDFDIDSSLSKLEEFHSKKKSSKMCSQMVASKIDENEFDESFTSTATPINISKEATEKALMMFKDLEGDSVLELARFHAKKKLKSPIHGLKRVSTFGNNEQRSMDGFTTASGSQIKISEERMKQASKMFQDFDIDSSLSKLEEFHSKKKSSKMCSQMFTAKDDQNQFDESDGNVPNTYRAESSTFSVLKEHEINVNKENNSYNKRIDFLTTNRQETKPYNISLINQDKFKKPESSSSMIKQRKINNCQKTANLLSNLKHLNDQQATTSSTTNKIQNLNFDKFSMLNISENVKINRIDALLKQQQLCGQNKSTFSFRTSELYMQKLHGKKLKYCDIQKYANSKSDNLLNRSNICDVMTFKFNMFRYYSKDICEENIDGIDLHDNVKLIMDKDSQVGYDELCSAFYSCPYVDRKLIPAGWVPNHLKWILTKLMAMQTALIKLEEPILTPENVLMQLKYRYDRDIVKSEKSILRQILEGNWHPIRLSIVVFISKIAAENDDIEICDGWYGVNAKIDSILRQAIDSGKITIGTKIIVQFFEIIDGKLSCSPLDIKSKIKFKICGNSTRTVPWDTKLGIYKTGKPFRISLNAVLANGGMIRRLDVYILRVYPVTFNDSTENQAVIDHQTSRKKRKSLGMKTSNRKKRQKNETSTATSSVVLINQNNSLLKVKVIDAYCPMKTAILYLRDPSESISNLINEQQFIQISNIIATNSNSHELSILGTNDSIVKQFYCNNFDKFSLFNRKLTNLFELFNDSFVPIFDEIDVVGFVIFNREENDKILYLVDELENCLCIKIADENNSLKEIKSKQCIAVSNIKYKKNHLQQYEAIATDRTDFSINPKLDTLKLALSEFENRLIDAKKISCIELCTRLITANR